MLAATRRTTVASQITAGTRSAALGVLIFDGDCGFCTTAARKFGDLAGGSAQVAPWQSLELGDYGLTEAEASSAAYWVQNGTAYRGADAAAQALQVCNPALAFLGKVIAAPPFIWAARAIYPVIARYRHRLPGATDACRID